jgi:hypothetical protein
MVEPASIGISSLVSNYRMALDLFSIPRMSAECERVFSQTKKMITDERNRLAPEVVEADQLQKHWLMRGLVV